MCCFALPVSLSLYIEVNLFWAAHQVHHSSEEYNLSTALRQSATQGLTSWVRDGGASAAERTTAV